MTLAAPLLLLTTVLLGAWLAALGLRPDAKAPPGPLRIAHGGLGAAATALTIVLLTRTIRPVSALTWEASGLLAMALILGLVLWRMAAHLGPHRGMVIALHALIGATGAAILSGWALR